MAFGTSKPELFVNIFAGNRGTPEIAVGSVIVSNIFNIFFILGINSGLSAYFTAFSPDTVPSDESNTFENTPTVTWINIDGLHEVERIESMEEELISEPTENTLQQIHSLKREMIFLRKSVWPLRELISGLQRIESPLIQEST